MLGRASEARCTTPAWRLVKQQFLLELTSTSRPAEPLLCQLLTAWTKQHICLCCINCQEKCCCFKAKQVTLSPARLNHVCSLSAFIAQAAANYVSIVKSKLTCTRYFRYWAASARVANTRVAPSTLNNKRALRPGIVGRTKLNA